MTPRLIDAILALVPTAQVTVRGDEIEWIDPPQAPVTDAQIQETLAQLTASYPAALIRDKRDALLTGCDWTQMSDSTPTAGKPAWVTYRQSLRDLTKQSGFPSNVVWPAPPTN